MPQPSPRDEHFLRHAIALSHQVRRQGKHPFAALVVDAAGQIVAEAGNDSLPPEGDPTRHAELLAAALAARHLPPEVLAGRAGANCRTTKKIMNSVCLSGSGWDARRPASAKEAEKAINMKL